MKLYKKHTKEPFSFLVINYFKMTVIIKVKTINNKIKQNKVEYNLDK